MTVRHTAGTQFLRVLRDGTAVIPDFTFVMTQEDALPRLEAELEVEIDARGRARCRRLTLVPREDGAEITAESLRAVSLTDLCQRAAEHVATFAKFEGVKGDTARFGPLTAEERLLAGGASREKARGRSAHPQEIAEVCREARANGRNEALAIMDTFRVSKSAAYRYKARASTLNGPYRP